MVGGPAPGGGRLLAAWLILEPDPDTPAEGVLDRVRERAAATLPGYLLPTAWAWSASSR
ncbi:hypothetical protein GXW82_04435 [Streptacidiphilus sp. 4-A2]|nr:hypothetical protein [Streptacidiphilus sp. 4-A2]